jgi:polyphosphate glucokinase
MGRDRRRGHPPGRAAMNGAAGPHRSTRLVIGVDIGGSGIKAAIVDTSAGRLADQRRREATPHHPTPAHVADEICALMDALDPPGGGGLPGTIGVGFPGVVRSGVVATAAHLDESWISTDAAALLAERTGRRVTVVNDADAAGLAEVRFGAGADTAGVVVMVTLGTGIGTGVFVDGILVPNTELGHLEVDGHDAETRAAAAVKDRKGLSWKTWGKRLDRYLAELEHLLSPDLIVVGGGISADFDRFAHRIHRSTPVVAALLGNDAGIIGAAVHAADRRDASS